MICSYILYIESFEWYTQIMLMTFLCYFSAQKTLQIFNIEMKTKIKGMPKKMFLN